MRRILTISFLVMMLAQSMALADVVLIVRREAEASGNYVRICDIARVEGPRQQADEVSRTVLGPTPPRGKALEISRWDIESRLYEMGIAARIIFTGNDSVKVLGNGASSPFAYADSVALRDLDQPYNPSDPLSMRLGGGAGGGMDGTGSLAASGGTGERMGPPSSRRGNPLEGMTAEARDRVGKIISHYLAAKYDRADIEVEAMLTAVSSAIPYSVFDIEVDKPVNGQIPGRATLQLKVKDDRNEPARLVTVDADTSVFALAPVAAKPLPKGEVLQAQDVAVQRVRMESGKTYLPPRAKAAAGRQLTRELKKGDPILASDAVPTQAVKRGDTVQVTSSSAGWTLTGSGVAMGGGMPGEVIQVQDSSTKTKYDARITEPGVVEIIVKPRK